MGLRFAVKTHRKPIRLYSKKKKNASRFFIFYKKEQKILDKGRKMRYNEHAFGVMAQLVERLVRNEEASGSNPLSSTKKIRMVFAVRIFCTPIVGSAESSAVLARG